MEALMVAVAVVVVVVVLVEDTMIEGVIVKVNYCMLMADVVVVMAAVVNRIPVEGSVMLDVLK